MSHKSVLDIPECEQCEEDMKLEMQGLGVENKSLWRCPDCTDPLDEHYNIDKNPTREMV